MIYSEAARAWITGDEARFLTNLSGAELGELQCLRAGAEQLHATITPLKQALELNRVRQEELLRKAVALYKPPRLELHVVVRRSRGSTRGKAKPVPDFIKMVERLGLDEAIRQYNPTVKRRTK